MRDLPSRRLADLVEVRHRFAFDGKYFRDERATNVLLTPGNVAVGGGFQPGTPKYYDGPVPEDFVLAEGDLFVTMTDLSKNGDTLGYPAWVPRAPAGRRYLHNQRLGRILLRPEAPLDPRYLYYVLCSREYRQEVLATATGSTVRHTSPSRIGAYELALPRLEVQQRIAGILGALDDKIGLNRRMAETIEGLVRAAYAELQANGRDDWTVGSIADVALNPRDQVDPTLVDPSTPYIGLEHVPRGRMVLGEWGQAAAAESGKMAFQRNDILFGKLRPYFRKVGVVPTSGICSTDIIVIRARRPEDLGYVLAVATDAAFIEAANAASTGTRMPRTSWSDLVRYPLLIPPTSARAAFTKRVWPLIERAQAAAFENSTLEQVRDTLLPRLLSGDIEVAA